jgi:hypothetical protein
MPYPPVVIVFLSYWLLTDPSTDLGKLMRQVIEARGSYLLVVVFFVAFQKMSQFRQTECADQLTAGFEFVAYSTHLFAVLRCNALLEYDNGLLGIGAKDIHQFHEPLRHDFL